MIGVRAILLTTLVAGCQSHAASRDHDADDASITAAKNVWQARDLNDYRFVWQQTCFCLPDAVQPIVVTVHNGAIVAATGRDGAAVSDDVRQNLLTLDALYRFVDETQRSADTVRVAASADGIPTKVFIDPRRSVADDEFDVTISEFIATAP